VNSGYPEIELVDPVYFSKQHEYDYLPLLECWEKCARCSKSYLKWHENQIRLGNGYDYCSRECEALQVTRYYLLMSVPFDTKFLRGR
jgi:hypothetical protein